MDQYVWTSQYVSPSRPGWTLKFNSLPKQFIALIKLLDSEKYGSDKSPEWVVRETMKDYICWLRLSRNFYWIVTLTEHVSSCLWIEWSSSVGNELKSALFGINSAVSAQFSIVRMFLILQLGIAWYRWKELFDALLCSEYTFSNTWLYLEVWIIEIYRDISDHKLLMKNWLYSKAILISNRSSVYTLSLSFWKQNQIKGVIEWDGQLSIIIAHSETNVTLLLGITHRIIVCLPLSLIYI